MNIIPPKLSHAVWPTLTLALTMTLAGPVAGLTGATLVDDQLQASPIKLASLQDGTISYFDDQRRLQQRPVEDFVMLRGIGEEPDAANEPADFTPSLVLVDGQRITGRWLGVSGDGQHLRWSHPTLGEVIAPLEDIRGITRTAELPEPQSGDQVVLANGDVLAGFVDGLDDQAVRLVPQGGASSLFGTRSPVLGHQAVRLVPQGGASAVPLPVERVAALRLANPDLPMPPGVQAVVLRDGTRLFASDLQIGGDAASFTASLPGRAGAAVTVPLTDVSRVELTAGGYRLVDLRELPRQILEGGETFGFARPPRTDGQDLMLHAPVRVAIALPDGAQRLAATARLDLTGVPADRHDWAGCELILQDAAGDPLLPGQQLDAGHGRGEINVPLAGNQLILELDPSVNGPILDRVRLTEAVILLRVPRQAGY